MGRVRDNHSIPRNLGEVCIYSKRWLRSGSTDSKKITWSLIESTPSLLGRKTSILFPPLIRCPCAFKTLVYQVICGYKDLCAPIHFLPGRSNFPRVSPLIQAFGHTHSSYIFVPFPFYVYKLLSLHSKHTVAFLESAKSLS